MAEDLENKGRDDDEDDAPDSEEPPAEEEPPKAVAKPPAKGAKRAKRAAAPAKEVVAEAPPPKQAAVPLASVAHLVFVVAAAVAVYSFVSVAKEGELRRRCTPTCLLRPNYSGYEKKIPSFKLHDTKGREVAIESYRGKVVVLNLWTKTCGPCMEEMPEVADLARILKPMNDVELVTISTDETGQDATDTLKSVLRDDPPFQVLMDPEGVVTKSKLGTTLFPETWIIDKDGVVRARFDGQREWSSATVVELVNQIRGGGYCPVQAREGKFVAESARMCEGLSGGS